MADDMLKQGETLFAEGKLEEAEKSFLSLLEKNSEDVEALNNLGVIHYAKGNVEEAESYFLKALAIKADYVNAMLNLADLYQNAKCWKDAAIQLEKFIAIENKDTDAFNRLGVVYLEMGNIEKARIALKKSLELNADQEIVRESLKALEKKTSPSMDCKGEIEKGKTLFAEGKIEEAERCFLEIVKHDSKNAEAYNNLGVIALQQRNIEQAFAYFTKALEIAPFYKYAVLNYSEVLRALGRLHAAIPILEKGIEKHPNDRELSQLLHEVRLEQRPRTKIAVLCLPGLQSFLGDIVDYLKTKYDVRTCYSNNNQEIESAVQWADLVWLEWANQMAIHVTNKIPQIKDKKVICRLHGYEVFTDMPAHINWSVVDSLLFVAKHKQGIFNKKFKIQSPPQTVIRNGVNTNKFTIAENKQNTKRLVLLGHLNFRKGLPILLHFYHQLLKHDPEYYLYIRGEFQDPRLEMAAHTMIGELSLTNKLEFVDWVDDLNAWFADKSHILSFSLEESFHYAIGNGMAAGLKPVIHAWEESREIWPSEFIFKDLCDFLRIMEDPQYTPGKYRQALFGNSLTSEIQVAKIIDMICCLTMEMNASNATESVSVLNSDGTFPEDSVQVADIISNRRDASHKKGENSAFQVIEGMVSIVVPTNTKEYLEECITSIEANTSDYSNYEIIIVNDGSDEPEFLEYLAGTLHRVVHLPKKSGFAKANNAGFRIAQGEYIMTLNADTVVHPGWLSQIVRTLDLNDKIAAVGPTILDIGTDIIQAAGSKWEEEDYRKVRPQHKGLKRSECLVSHTYYQVDVLVGVCILFRRNSLYEVGLFDENYLNGWEDIDICLSFLEKNYEIYHAPAVIEHKGGFVRNTFDISYYRRLVQKNRAYFLTKWSGVSIVNHTLIMKKLSILRK